MEQISNEIRTGYADPHLNGMLASIGSGSRPFSRHFNHFGDPFLLLQTEYAVSSLPIHHDVRERTPRPEYLASLRTTVARIAPLAPQVFRGLGYFFDPTEILRPCFYEALRQGDDPFLFLLRLDLEKRPAEGEVIERGTSDVTPSWRSRKLFFDAVLVPLVQVPPEGGTLQGFRALQAVSETYIGEVDSTGRGGWYSKQGVWMDPRLTQFFSSLLLPPGALLHPFHPFLCHYKTVCSQPLDLSPEGRRAAIPPLQRALAFLLPVMDRIQSALGKAEFSEHLPIFEELKQKVPESWYEPWRGLRIGAYLNEHDRKEYRIDA